MMRPLSRALCGVMTATFAVFSVIPIALAHPSARPAPAPVMARPVVSLPQPPTRVMPLRPLPRMGVARVQRPGALRPPVFVPGFVGGFAPLYATRPVVIVREIERAPARNTQITISRLTVVPGIRRPPEAAPVIYRIDDPLPSRRWREAPRLAGETTLPRIVHVRTR